MDIRNSRGSQTQFVDPRTVPPMGGKGLNKAQDIPFSVEHPDIQLDSSRKIHFIVRLGQTLLASVQKIISVVRHIFASCFSMKEEAEKRKNIDFLQTEFERVSNDLFLKLADSRLYPDKEKNEYTNPLTALHEWNRLHTEFQQHTRLMADFKNGLKGVLSKEEEKRIDAMIFILNEQVARLQKILKSQSTILLGALFFRYKELTGSKSEEDVGIASWVRFRDTVAGWEKLGIEDKKIEEMLSTINQKLPVNSGSFHSSRSIGFPNLGATCYMNSFLQNFVHHPSIRNKLLNPPDDVEEKYRPLFKAFEKLDACMEEANRHEQEQSQNPNGYDEFRDYYEKLFRVPSIGAAKRTLALREALNGFFQSLVSVGLFRENEIESKYTIEQLLNETLSQEEINKRLDQMEKLPSIQKDPDEFIPGILEALKLTFPMKHVTLFPIPDQVEQTKEVAFSKPQHELETVIHCPIPSKRPKEQPLTLKLLLDTFFEASQIDEFKVKDYWIDGEKGEELVNMDEELILTNAEQMFRIEQLPEVMPILLERTGFFGESQKISDPIDIDITQPIHLAPYCVEKDLPIEETDYYLTGFYVHSGGADFGHYVSVIREGKVWKKYDDATVTTLTVSQVRKLAKTMYGGFFTQKKKLSILDFSGENSSDE